MAELDEAALAGGTPVVCTFCGRQYSEHEDPRPDGTPVPKTPCLLLKSGLIARVAKPAAKEDPRIAIVREWASGHLVAICGNDCFVELLSALDSAPATPDEVERVAVALAEETNRQIMHALTTNGEEWTDDHRVLARVAIEALRRRT